MRYDGAMSEVARKDILNLSVAERIELIGDLSDSTAETPETIELTEAQKAEFDRPVDAHRKDPTTRNRWPDVRQRTAKFKGGPK